MLTFPNNCDYALRILISLSSTHLYESRFSTMSNKIRNRLQDVEDDMRYSLSTTYLYFTTIIFILILCKLTFAVKLK